ncbi:MAG: glycosyl transferase, partial [Candidatus Rokubacteria bacterium]|nr:glycosyl transferase [Candidatus Rokubacteria bacterium]
MLDRLSAVAIWVLFSFGLSLGLTLLCERLARRIGLVALPREDRWHGAPVPLLGGVAIVVGTLVPLAVSTAGTRDFLVLGLAALGMAAVGLVDDIYSLKPQLKLIAQIVIATALLYSGFLLRLSPSPLLNIFLTLLWIVGITNAFNLLDNMDGLAAGVAAIAAGSSLLLSLWELDSNGALAAAIFLGACLGFLPRNFPPARIFMGDAGSYFLGVFLAGLSLIAQFPYSRGITAVLALPVLILLVPIFDTAFVTITRLFSGRPLAVGGRDHTSHRLVSVGVSERWAVVFFYGITASSGILAILSYQVGFSYSVVLLSLLVLVVVLLGVYLAGVRQVTVAPASRPGAVLHLVADFPYKRQVLTVALDLVLIVLAYYTAYLLRFEQGMASEVKRFFESLPLVLVSQLIALVATGLYRGVWRYV